MWDSSELPDSYFEAAWGPANRVAPYVAVECSKEQAIKLSRLFYEHVLAIAECCYYDGKTLFMYCGDAGHGSDLAVATAEGIIVGFGLLPLGTEKH